MVAQFEGGKRAAWSASETSKFFFPSPAAVRSLSLSVPPRVPSLPWNSIQPFVFVNPRVGCVPARLNVTALRARGTLRRQQQDSPGRCNAIRAQLKPDQQKTFDEIQKKMEERRAERAEFEAWKAEKDKKAQ